MAHDETDQPWSATSPGQDEAALLAVLQVALGGLLERTDEPTKVLGVVARACADHGIDLTDAAVQGRLAQLYAGLRQGGAPAVRKEGGSKEKRGTEVLMSCLAVVLDRLVLTKSVGHPAGRLKLGLSMIGRKLAHLFGASIDEVEDELNRLERGGRIASDAAIRLMRKNLTWLVHPLVAEVVLGWRVVRQSRYDKLQRPIENPAGEYYDDCASKSQWFVDEYTASRGLNREVGALDVDTFLRQIREIHEALARARGTFEALREDGASIAKALRHAKSGSGLCEAALGAMLGRRAAPVRALREEIAHRYGESRAQRTLRDWIDTHVPRANRAVPRTLIERHKRHISVRLREARHRVAKSVD